MEVASDGWQEHEAIMERKDKEYNKAMYHAMKSCCVYGRYIGFNWKPGQWESIFGGKGEGREKDERQSDEN